MVKETLCSKTVTPDEGKEQTLPSDGYQAVENLDPAAVNRTTKKESPCSQV